MSPRNLSSLLTVALTLIVLAGPLHAQTVPSPPGTADVEQRAPARPDAGRVVGVVVAPDDARLPGVTITITSKATAWSFVTVTADHGRFSGSSVPPGDHEIKAELYGFQPQTVRVSLAPGETTEVNFTLALSTISETVDVVGALLKESIEASEIRESSALDIGDALGRLNGVYKIRKGAIANDVIVHGFQSRNLTVLIDGQRIYGACPNGMDPAVFHADFAEVDHLDVGKGPFDVRHEGSLGGVVNVVTRAPGKGIHGNPNLSLGSNGYANPSVTASFGTDRLSVLGGYSYRASDVYQDGTGAPFTQYANFRPDRVNGKAFTANTGWFRVFVAPREGQGAQLAYTRQKATGVKYAYLQMDGIWDTADRLNLSYDIAGAGRLFDALSTQAYYTRVSHWMTDQDRLSSVGAAREYSMASQADTETAGGSVELVVGPVTTGVEAYRRNWSVATMLGGAKFVPQYSVPDVHIDHLGAFAEYRRPLGDAKLEMGGRVDWANSVADGAKANTDLFFAYKGTRSTSASDATASGKIRLTRRVTPSLEVNAGVGHTERVPDPQERYFALKRMGSDWVGNPALRPTGNTGWTAGVNYQYRRMTVTTGVFYDHLTNFVALHSQPKINAVPGIANSLSRSYDSVNARMWSGEVTVTCPITDRLFTTLNASYTRGTKDRNPAKRITSANIAEIHPLMSTFVVRYDRAVFFGEVETMLSGAHMYVDTDLQEDPIPSYGVVNLRVGAERRKVRLTVTLNNVFDTLYVDHMSYQRDPFRIGARVREPGRNMYVNLSYRF